MFRLHQHKNVKKVLLMDKKYVDTKVDTCLN